MSDRVALNPLGIDWASLVGKRVLVGLTVRTAGVDAELEQFHGRIVSADAKNGLKIALLGRTEPSTCWLPPDLRSFHPAPPGDYRLRSTGEIVTDPDYLTTWFVDRDSSSRDRRSSGSSG